MKVSSLKSSARWLARQPAIGAALAAGLQGVGAVHLGRRVALLNGSTPPDVVTVQLPARLFAEPALSMYTVGGRDQFAMYLWARGWEAYEKPLPEIFSASIRDGDVVLDIGANTGFYALLAASVGQHVQVYAFEPFPVVADLLAENLRLCPQGKRVSVVREAVDEVAGTCEFYIPTDDHGLVEASASLAPEFRAEHSQVLQVTTTTIDAFVRSSGAQRVDVVKIDVEGVEERAFAGGREVLRKFRPTVFFEVLETTGWQASCDKLDSIRRELGYLSVRLPPTGPVCVPRIAPDPRARNQALWPAERIGWLRQVSARLGYAVTSDDESLMTRA